MENRHHKSAPVIVVVITLRPGYRLKELLGHSNIINTMVYLHIIKSVEEISFSPIDRLFPVK